MTLRVRPLSLQLLIASVIYLRPHSRPISPSLPLSLLIPHPNTNKVFALLSPPLFPPNPEDSKVRQPILTLALALTSPS